MREVITKEHLNKKQYILDVAERIFAKLAFKGASTRVIAKEAGINSAMLSYYFGSKDGLFVSIFERKIYALQSLLHDIAVDTDRFLVNDNFQKLIHREMSLGSRFDVTENITQMLMTNIQEFKLILLEGVKNGSFTPDADTQLLTTMIVGMKNYIINTPNICSLLVDHDVTEDVFLVEQLKPRLKLFLKRILRDHLSFS